ncbi:MAG: LCP family protein [Actinobacteria bacterium]|nr:LCP family protein [Actinomycetota bacterium]
MVGKHRVKKKKKPLSRWTVVFFLTLMVGVGLTGYLYGKAIEGKLHGGARSKELALPGPEPEKPVTFLVVGSDSRGKDKGRSDTLMILRLNPRKKVASLISIPRDMRVEIPGNGTDKINAAYSLGGAELTIETVQQFTGLEMNHFIEVDFQGFKRLVDSLGGIDIDIRPPNGRSRLKDPEIDLDIPRGMQHLNGDEALKFVRVRHVDDDFGRVERQQQFLRAVFEKAVKPSSLAKLPQLAEIVTDNVRTDSGLGLREMLAYGQLLRSIPRENVRMATLPGDSQMMGGVSYVVPQYDKMDWLLGRLKNDQTFETTKEEVANANIVVDIQNGSGVQGQGLKMADALKLKGFTVGEISNADNFSYERTQILATPESYAKAKKVHDALGLGDIVSDRINGSSIIIVVGRDFVEKNGRGTSPTSSRS